ncbi:UNVERIFIED_CONTAM: hypothetical protein GTU68_057465 [Idotea baltica]|nr:hypothetical protein [Idotea baltica]
MRIDAQTGALLDKNDWVSHCAFGDGPHPTNKHVHETYRETPPAGGGRNPDDYRVFALPLESPSHGARTLEVNPANVTASPFGWHDTNGSTGAEYTITRGNNVYAYEDRADANQPGYSPDGGTGLVFDFPLNLNQAPQGYEDPAITNLFYWNNIMHDVWYHYGFDELSGNFQQNNYGNGGSGNDPVDAEAQDGGGTNNANFATPPDGQNPRMQMYLWTSASNAKDGDFDNGIIAHEYGHGISNRLTGGPSAAGCLGNAEQMGEGWSDWFGLMLTIEPGDQDTDVRGIGTYATGQTTTGTGIRPAPYSTSFGVNNFTYASTNNAGLTSQPHGIGFVWCSMLWDMNWALIDQYGYDPDLYSGTGGNNIAMQLVIDALKLQPCSPGFVDGRDAILQADQINYNGANQCLIWEVFANRGLGFSASQGSSASRTDQVEAFDIPPICETPTAAPNAVFAFGEAGPCTGEVQFTDQSTSTPQSWTWDFGDGNNSTLQNPSHIYTASGTYTVTLTVSNTLGADVSTQTVVVVLLDPPTMSDGEGCINTPITMSGSVNGQGYIQWQDQQGNVVGSGNTYTTGPLAANTAYNAYNIIAFPPGFAGPLNNSIGGGGYHGTTFTGTVEFTADDALTILSAWVDADGAGNRDLFLFDDQGNTLQQISVNIPNGPGRVSLGFNVPGPGDYSVGGTGVDLYRNNTGASYPYTLQDIMTITGSPAGPDFYYYLYDLEVQRDSCISDPAPVNATVIDANFTYLANLGMLDFTDASSGANSWMWDFGDGNTSTQQNPSHTYAQNGTYTVTLSINGGACTFVETIEVVVVGIEDIFSNPASVVIMPNPTAGGATLILNEATKKLIEVQVVGMDGRILMETEIGRGSSQVELDMTDYPNGMYYVNLKSGDQQVVKKLVVQQ